MTANHSNPVLPDHHTLQSLLIEIDRIAAEKSHHVGWLSYRSELFQPIENVTDQFLSERLSKLSDSSVDALITIIKSRRERLSLSSGITDQIVGISQQILAFGAGGLALTIGFIDKIKQFSILVQKLLAIIGIFYTELVLLSLLVLIWYMLQARFRYPWLYFQKIGNAWPFFYYAAITPVARVPIQTGGQRFEASVTYAKDFAAFSEKLLVEDSQGQLRAELQQYFLLLSYQAYVHQFSLRLANIFTYGFAAALATLAFMVAGVTGGFL